MTLARCDHSAGMDDEYPIVAEREYEHGTSGGDAGALFPHTQDLLTDIAYYCQHLAQDVRDDIPLKFRRLFVLATNLGHALSDSCPAY